MSLNDEINHAHHARYVHSAHIRIIRVMCSGRVEPTFILEAFKDKVDGVLIMGCHIGDCHYLEGNVNAEIRINNTKEALKYLGLDGRLRLEWVSASEGARFAEVVSEFTEEIRKLGPSPLKETGCVSLTIDILFSDFDGFCGFQSLRPCFIASLRSSDLTQGRKGAETQR